MPLVIAFFSSFLFGVGLTIAGMTDPKNIIGFLDLFGEWKPALIFVMVGAIGFHAVSYYFIKRKQSPLLAEEFQVPTKRDLDLRLIIGSALFGIGWGVGGFCPGPAIASVVSLDQSVLIFLGSMCVGIAIFHYVFKPVWLEGKK